jgi:hypothetical protein
LGLNAPGHFVFTLFDRGCNEARDRIYWHAVPWIDGLGKIIGAALSPLKRVTVVRRSAEWELRAEWVTGATGGRP